MSESEGVAIETIEEGCIGVHRSRANNATMLSVYDKQGIVIAQVLLNNVNAHKLIDRLESCTLESVQDELALSNSLSTKTTTPLH